MIKHYYSRLVSKMSKRSRQEQLIHFIDSKKTVEKAAEGSMQKRIDLFQKADLRKRNA